LFKEETVHDEFSLTHWSSHPQLLLNSRLQQHKCLNVLKFMFVVNVRDTEDESYIAIAWWRMATREFSRPTSIAQQASYYKIRPLLFSIQVRRMSMG
jgi:hypothetical protein